MITTIIFDFAGVVSKRRFFPVVAENLSKKYGISEENVLQSLRNNATQYMAGKESTEDFWKKVCLGLDIPYGEFVNIFSSSYELNFEVTGFIRKLKEKYQVFLLSDNFNALSQTLRRDVRLDGLFEKMYFSDEIHLVKEDKEFFLHMLNDIRKNPEECLFIDDQENNVVLARSLGIKSLLFTNYETLFLEMKELGLRHQRRQENKNMKIRLVTRVVTFDPESRKILLVKNTGQDFWYPPGGGWEYEKENIIECAEREVYEETGLRVKVLRLLYVQEFHEAEDSISFETVWLAGPIDGTKLNESHVDFDTHGKIETAKWFSEDEVKEIKVFPKRLKETFWVNLEGFLQGEDPFLGVS